MYSIIKFTDLPECVKFAYYFIFCNLANKAGKTTQKSSPSQQKQKRLDSDDDFVAGEDKHDDDGRDELPLRQQGKGKTTLPKKRSSTDLQWDSDDDIAPGRHKKTKKVLSESDDEDEPLQSTKKKEVVKPVLPVLKDESSGSDEDVKPASTKVHNSKCSVIHCSQTAVCVIVFIKHCGSLIKCFKSC